MLARAGWILTTFEKCIREFKVEQSSARCSHSFFCKRRISFSEEHGSGRKDPRLTQRMTVFCSWRGAVLSVRTRLLYLLISPIEVISRVCSGLLWDVQCTLPPAGLPLHSLVPLAALLPSLRLLSPRVPAPSDSFPATPRLGTAPETLWKIYLSPLPIKGLRCLFILHVKN